MIGSGGSLIRCTVAVVAISLLAGCEGVQSALSPAGKAAEQIADLFWAMAAGAIVIWLVTIGLAIYSVRTRSTDGMDAPERARRIRICIIGGGAILPTIVLTGLLIYSLPLIPKLLSPPPPGSLRVDVRGKMWWWRVRYDGAINEPGQSVELANEIWLPVDEPVEFVLRSDDVIHAFWIPSLGGKVDMIPGRITRLKLEPTAAGIFRGACAEYCGASHALMNFDVRVVDRPEFETWLRQQSEPARTPVSPDARRGRDLFFSSGCQACHTIRGTAAAGVIGPDLTHVGSRRSLAAGALPNDHDAFVRWISRPEAIKPGAKMPPFGMLPANEINDLAAYMESLQ